MLPIRPVDTRSRPQSSRPTDAPTATEARSVLRVPQQTSVEHLAKPPGGSGLSVTLPARRFFGRPRAGDL
jgi:hypothetical protein